MYLIFFLKDHPDIFFVVELDCKAGGEATLEHSLVCF